MKVVICVPWRGGDPSREKLWDAMRPALERTGFPVHTGDSDPALPFNRAAARNAAADAAGDWDLAIFVDADTYIPFEQMGEALYLASLTQGGVMPYDEFVSMNPETLAVTPRLPNGGSNFAISGNIVVARAAFDAVGGWDESISGYGWEDGAFCRMLLALRTLRQVPGRIVAYEHYRTEDEDPNVLLERGKPPELKVYDDPLAHAHTLRAQRARVREAVTIDS